MALDVDAWLKAGRYLPKPLRDFHDSKEVFKTMHSVIDVSRNDYAKHVTWITGQCYVIDIFLWFMARRGWTLQRVRAKGSFVDLAADIEARRQVETAAFKDYLASRKPAVTPTVAPATEAAIKDLVNKDTID